MSLTDIQKKFIDNYIETGNATQSYIDAGYKARGNSAEANASRLLRNVKAREYIEERNKALESPRIATMTEVKEFWTNTMNAKNEETKDRLKASELIAKTNGAFLDKVEHSGKLGVTIIDDVK